MYNIVTNSDLKMLHFCFALDPELAGVATGVTNICVQTSDFGLSHQIVSLGNSYASRTRGRTFIDQLKEAGTEVFIGKSLFTNQYGIGSIPFALKLLLRRPTAHVIVLHQLYTFSTFWGWALGKIYSIPLILFPHGTLTLYHERDSKFRKLVAKKLFLNKVIADCELLIATSESEKYEIEKLTGRRVTIISYGLDGFFGDGELRPWVNPNLLFVGRFTKKKNLDKLIEAIGILRFDYPQINLNAIGYRNASEIEPLKVLISNLALEDCVNLVSWTSGDSLKRYYESADLFVLTSENENFGLVVAEALSYGLPCLVSKDVALSELIRDNNAGIVITDSDPGTIATGVKTCLDYGFLNRKANAQQLVQMELSWKNISEQWKLTVENFYK